MIKKNKLNADNIIQFFTDKPVFDKSETDSTIKYGWSSTKDGLYSITDMYRYFENKGFNADDVDDIMYKAFQKDTAFAPSKLEKGKTHRLFYFHIKNFNPSYHRSPYFIYYFLDLTKEKVLELKREYELQSYNAMLRLIETRKSAEKESKTDLEDSKSLKPKIKVKKSKTLPMKNKTIIEI